MTAAPAVGFLSPRLGERSLTEVITSVGAAMGLSDFDDQLSLPAAPSYVVFLVDGLGEHNLRQHAAHAPYLAGLLDRHEPLTCGVPSTTATSLTSLTTGLGAGRHGVVGYTSRIPGTERLMNSLKWDPAVTPEIWQPHASALARVEEAGALAAVVNKAEFAGSGLTLAGMRDVDFHGVDSVWERLDTVCDLAERPGSLTYCYESELDHTGHARGCESPEWLEVLRSVDAEAERLRDELPAEVALLVTADHGMIDVPGDDRLEVDDVPGLLDDVELLGGEARFRHLYTRGGAVEDVTARWRGELADRAAVVTRDEAIDLGWFGPVDDTVRPRLGDVMVACAGTFAVLARRWFHVETKMVGFHGSLTAAEMQVPLLVDAG
jgi:hypothetical protein